METYQAKADSVQEHNRTIGWNAPSGCWHPQLLCLIPYLHRPKTSGTCSTNPELNQRSIYLPSWLFCFSTDLLNVRQH